MRMKNKALPILLLCGLLTASTLPVEALNVLHEGQNMAGYSIVDESEMDNIQCGRADEIDLEAIKANRAELGGYLNADKSNPAVGIVEDITQLPNGNHLINILVRSFSEEEEDNIDMENPPSDLFVMNVLMELRLAPVWDIENVTLDGEREAYSYDTRIWGCQGWEKREIKNKNTSSSIGMPTMRERPQADTEVFTGELGVNITPYIEAALGRRLNSAIILTSSYSGYRALNANSRYKNLTSSVPPAKKKKVKDEYSQRYQDTWKGSEKDGKLDLKTEMELEKIKESSGKLDAWNHDDPWNHGPYKDLPLQVTQEDGYINIQAEGLAESLGLGKDFFEKRRPNTIEDAQNLMEHVKATPPIFGEPVVVSVFVGKDIKPSAMSGESSRKEVKASAEEGEQDIDIPASAVALASGIAAGGATLAWKRRKKGKASEADSTEEEVEKEKEEEEEKGESTYRMKVYKDYGNILFPGQEVKISAKIVEITADGRVLDAPDLTQLIGIHADNYLEVYGQTMSGQYKSASVRAPEKEHIPREAKVIFSFACYTVVMKFDVVMVEVHFGQENLTIPACYDKAMRLPFVVSGIEAGVDPVEAVITPAGNYDVQVEWCAEEKLYYAVITELNKEKDDAGRVECCTLRVTASKGKYSVEGKLPVCRLHLGLAVYMDNGLDCFIKIKPGLERIPEDKRRASDYQIAQNVGRMDLFIWNEECNKVERIAPIPQPMELKAINPENEELLENLGIELFAQAEPLGGGRSFNIMCTKGSLATPNRFKAKIKLGTEYEGKLYTWEDELIIRSMPVLQFSSMEERMHSLERDKRARKLMQDIKEVIEGQGYYEHLFVLVRMIDMAERSYDSAYGYDYVTVNKIVDTYQRFLRGETLGANGDPIVVTWSDVVLETLDNIEKMNSLLYMGGRLAVGVLSGGVTEAVIFQPLDTYYLLKNVKGKMIAAADKTDSPWDFFVIGIKEVGKEVLMDAAMDKGMALAGGAGRTAKELAEEVAPNATKKVTESLDELVKGANKKLEKVKDYLNRVDGHSTAQAGRAANAAAETAQKSMERKLDKFRREVKYTDAELLSSTQLKTSQVKSLEMVEDLEIFDWMAKNNPTEANIRRYEEAVLKVQSNKFSMNHLMDRPGGTSMRKRFNKKLDKWYQDADLATKADLAEELSRKYGREIKPEQITTFKATGTSKNDLLEGKRITYDRDVTFNIEGIEGVEIDQEMAQRLYEKNIYKVTHEGHEAFNAQSAHEFAEKIDNTVVQKTSKENYGSTHDFNGMVKDQTLELENPNKVADTVNFKSQENFAKARASQDQTRAFCYEWDAMRQAVKQYKYINMRNTSRMARMGINADQINLLLREKIALMNKVYEKTCNGLDLIEIRRAFNEIYNTTPEDVCREIANVLRRSGIKVPKKSLWSSLGAGLIHTSNLVWGPITKETYIKDEFRRVVRNYEREASEKNE